MTLAVIISVFYMFLIDLYTIQFYNKKYKKRTKKLIKIQFWREPYERRTF